MDLVQRERRVDLAGIADAIGLPQVEDPNLSKAKYLKARLDRLDSEEAIRETTRRFAERYPLPRHSQTFELEEILWRDTGGPPIQKRHRRELAQALTSVPLFIKGAAFMDLLESLFVLEDHLDPWRQSESLKEQIDRHMFRNEDWTTDYLFESLGAYDVSDARFTRLLTGLGSGAVRPDVDEQRRFAAVVNESLSPAGIALYERETSDGYLAFTLVARSAHLRNAPKNLIFASVRKPDLRFKDAISNDVEIVGDPDQVLIYDRSLSGGLTWGALQTWWAETRGLEPQAAKKSLYRRLLRSLPESSPQQRLLFESYFRIYRQGIPALPALLPEVYLHYDPVTVAARGRDALLRQRMDFLMLFPGNVRVILEVDGYHHHDTPAAYAAMTAADRDLRLLGYEVYRFGAGELTADKGPAITELFFRRLLARFQVRP
jgi:hypothetical protein